MDIELSHACFWALCIFEFVNVYLKRILRGGAQRLRTGPSLACMEATATKRPSAAHYYNPPQSSSFRLFRFKRIIQRLLDDLLRGSGYSTVLAKYPQWAFYDLHEIHRYALFEDRGFD